MVKAVGVAAGRAVFVLVVFIYSVGRGKQQVGLQLRAGAAAVSSLCGELIIQI